MPIIEVINEEGKKPLLPESLPRVPERAAVGIDGREIGKPEVVRGFTRRQMLQDVVGQQVLQYNRNFEQKLKEQGPEMEKLYKIYITSILQVYCRHSVYGSSYADSRRNYSSMVAKLAQNTNTAFGSTGNMWMTTFPALSLMQPGNPFPPGGVLVGNPPDGFFEKTILDCRQDWRLYMALQSVTLMAGTFLNIIKTSTTGISSVMSYGLLKEFRETLKRNIESMGDDETKRNFREIERESMPKARELIDKWIEVLKKRLYDRRDAKRFQDEGRTPTVGATSQMYRDGAERREKNEISKLLAGIELLEQYKSSSFMMDKQKTRILRKVTNFILSIPKMLGFMIICSNTAGFVEGAFFWAFGQLPADILRGARGLRKQYRNYGKNKVDEHIVYDVIKRGTSFMSRENGYVELPQKLGVVTRRRFTAESIDKGLLERFMGTTQEFTIDDKEIIAKLVKEVKKGKLGYSGKDALKPSQSSALNSIISKKLLNQVQRENLSKVAKGILSLKEEDIKRIIEENGGDAERLLGIINSMKDVERTQEIGLVVETNYARFMYNRTREWVERGFQSKSKMYATFVNIDKKVEIETFRRLSGNETYLKIATNNKYKNYDSLFTDKKRKPLVCRLGLFAPDLYRTSELRVKREKEEVKKIMRDVSLLWHDTRFLGLERFVKQGKDLKTDPTFNESLEGISSEQLAGIFRNEQRLYNIQLNLGALATGNGTMDPHKYLWKIINCYKSAKDEVELEAELRNIERKLFEELHYVDAKTV